MRPSFFKLKQHAVDDCEGPETVQHEKAFPQSIFLYPVIGTCISIGILEVFYPCKTFEDILVPRYDVIKYN